MSKTAQISFKTDHKLKDQALKKARSEGITLKALLSLAMKAYVRDDFSLGLQRREEPSEYFIKSLKEAEDDLRRGDVVSFDDSQKALKYLDNFKPSHK